MISVKCGKITFANNRPFVLMGGPCVIESERHAFDEARRLKKIASARRIPFIFKSSYDKANRSSVDSFRGPGLAEGLRILARIKRELGLPILTDVHTPQEAAQAARVA